LPACWIKKEERKITVANQDIELNFILTVQELTLPDVVIKNGEDPLTRSSAMRSRKGVTTKNNWISLNARFTPRDRCG
jgi:hypothetical protein